ncbi:hypothetical protein [Thermomonas flagellata]|uniref:hypothetical protein n=1 Tax=Thermomonas flagellata TaxID=2888524 RepID=UPI001F03E79B|nr:hypothetical protein [Thermomonas flagellata]
MNIRGRGMAVVAGGLLALLGIAAAHAGNRESPNVYRLDIAVEKGGARVATPKFTVAFGSPAVVVIADAKKNSGAYRIQATAAPGGKGPAGKGTVRIDMVVMEQISGAWVILGEPSLVAYEGQPASMELSGPGGGFRVSATATPEFDREATSVKTGACQALTVPVATNAPLPIVGIRQGSNCCTTGCADGSGLTMTCCGAMECCACGSCCRPPASG